MVVVGGGKAGARALIGLREHGHSGPITLITDETRAPYDRPPLSKAALAHQDEPEPAYLTDMDMLASLKVQLVSGSAATALNPGARTVTLANGTTLPYHKLLLATGAVPRPLPLPGATSPRVHTLRSFDDAVALRAKLQPGARVIVVGGGFIGLEVASSAAKRGAAATVIEGLPRVLSRGVPPEIAAVVTARHQAEGVDIRCSTTIAGLSEDATGISVKLGDGSTLTGDLMVVGIGALPVTALAETAGLRVDNGVAVDAEMRTSDPHIFAAGDCVSFPLVVFGGRRIRLESWRAAQDQGAVAAANMLGKAEQFTGVPWFWSDQFDLTLQIAGLQDEGERTVRRNLAGYAFVLFHVASDGRLVAASGIGRGNSIAKDVRLAEMIIAKGLKPAEADLADPNVNLKRLLTG